MNALRARVAAVPWLFDPDQKAPRERIAIAAAVLASVALGWPARGDLAGLDQSWAAGLHEAARLGLRHGVEVIFTYGPLGYLGLPWPFLGWTTAAAVLFTLLIKLGLAGLIVVVARRALALPLALLVLVALMRLLALPFVGGELIPLLGFLAACQLLGHAGPSTPSRPGSQARTDAVLALGGLLAAISLLGKLNAGVVVLLIVLVVAAATGRPWWRGLAISAGTFAVASLALWIASGQRLEDVQAFAIGARETVAGYTSAMARAAPGTPLARVDALLELAFVTALGYLGTRGWPLGRRIALAVVWLAFAGTLYLEGFTRDDPGHHAVFFVAMAIAVVTVLLRRRQAINTAIVAVFVTIAVTAAPSGLRLLVNPLPSLARLGGDLLATAQPWAWNDEAARTRAAIAAAYGLEPRLGDVLAGKTVHVDPVDAAVAIALPRSRWLPLPAFQSYGAYTSTLDDLNASTLRGKGAPEVVLRRQPAPTPGTASRPTSIDGRLLWWEQPAATLEILCRYRQEAIVGEWQVLARGSSRCGAATTLSTATAEIGQIVRIPALPAQDQLLVVRISPLSGNPIRTLRDLALGSRPWFAIVDDVRYRLVPGTVGDGLILSVPERLGWSPQHSFGPPIRSLVLSGGAPSGQVTLRFEVIPLGPE